LELKDRRVRYESIEAYRKRPLIVYATSTRANVNAMMAGDAVREFIDQLDALPADTKHIDVLVHSTGGDALAAWKLMSILRERFARVSVLVPFMAFSAATLFGSLIGGGGVAGGMNAAAVAGAATTYWPNAINFGHRMLCNNSLTHAPTLAVLFQAGKSGLRVTQAGCNYLQH
jgi:hypothetical protein